METKKIVTSKEEEAFAKEVVDIKADSPAITSIVNPEKEEEDEPEEPKGK